MIRIDPTESGWTRPQLVRLGALIDVKLNVLPGSKQNPGGNPCTGKGRCTS